MIHGHEIQWNRSRYREGKKAFQEKRSKYECPYIEGCEAYDLWHRGYRDAALEKDAA